MKKATYLLLAIIVLVSTQCKKEKPDLPRPEVTTGEYNPETSTAIGTIKHLSEYVMEYGHIWGGTTPTIDNFLDRSVNTDIISQDSVLIISPISDLQDNETYFIRAYVTDRFENTWYGDVVIQYNPSDYVEACFTASQTECETGSCFINFDASCSENAVQYKWDFDGDGVFELAGSDKVAVSYQYTSSGVYNSRLWVRSDKGIVDEDTLLIEVNMASPPLACFTPSQTETFVDDVIVFNASCSENAVDYLWDFGGGDIAITGNPIVSYVYGTSGIYDVELIIQSINGDLDSTSAVIQVNEPIPIEPVACLEVSPGTVQVGQTVTFDASCSENVLIYRWDFDGDGDFETGGADKEIVTHVFDSAGEYQTLLEVVSVDNITNQLIITIQVIN